MALRQSKAFLTDYDYISNQPQNFNGEIVISKTYIKFGGCVSSLVRLEG